jgi:ADP-dependent NAD(P)H-hydrate dehydratase
MARVPRLPPRDRAAHKGTFGTVGVWAGSRDMAGAAILCATAALRAGAGLVRVAVPASIQLAIAVGCPCATTIRLPAGRGARTVLLGAHGITAWVVGPGLTTARPVASLVRWFLGMAAVPVVLDADGLNALGRDLRVVAARKAPTVLTPHPGEAARLLGTTPAAVELDRRSAVTLLAKRARAVVCLKGKGTLVSDGRRVFRNTTGNPGMATGGTGDVLAGEVAALLARGLPAFDAAVLGVAVHGHAGDLAARAGSETGLIASDLLGTLPRAFRRHGG